MILCDNEGQLERLEELASGPSRAHARRGRARRRVRPADAPRADRPRNLPARAAAAPAAALPHRGPRAAARPLIAGRLRGAPRARHRDLSRPADHRGAAEGQFEVAVVEYEGGDALNVPLYRLDQLEPYRAAGDGDAPPAAAASPRRRHLAAPARQDPRGDPGMAAELLELYARRSLATGFAFPPDTPLAARAGIGLPLRRHSRPAPCDRRSQTRHGARPAHGSPARRRRRLRQDGGRGAGGLQGCASGQTGGRARARRRFSRSSTAARSASGWPTIPCGSKSCRASAARRNSRRCWSDWPAARLTS